MGIFDRLFGKKETPSEPKKDCCSKKEVEIKINTDDLPESPVKSIDDLDLDPETKKKLKSQTVFVGEDGVLPKDQEYIKEIGRAHV